MIEMRCIDSLFIPRIVCDSCGEVITNASKAAIVFGNFLNNGEKTCVLHINKNFVKGDCMEKAEGVIRSKGWEPGWDELKTHLAFLIKNAGMTPEDIEEKLSLPK